MANDQTYISLGGGIRLVAEDYYIETLGPSMTRTGFRKWCVDNSLKMVEIGSTRYVNPHQLEVTLAGMMRAESPWDVIYMPGCTTLTRGRGSVARLKDTDPSVIDWKAVVHDLIAWRRMNGASVTMDTRDSLRTFTKTLAADVISHRPRGQHAAE